jgi:aryl-alcohol dehydrogenase-like predicted oxidoreductase
MNTTAFKDLTSSNQQNTIHVGTANFNKSYGFGRRSSMFQSNDLGKLLFEVKNNENLFLETSQNYEGVEELIENHARGKLPSKITMKISPTKNDSYNSIISMVKNSLKKIGQESFYSVMLHNPEVLSCKNSIEIMQGLTECVNLGLTKKLGISSYESEQIVKLKIEFPDLTTFQINENVIDQRIINNSGLINLSQGTNKIFVRSIFLQGNLLVDYSDIAEILIPQREVFKKFIDLCDRNMVSQIKCCLDYAKQISWSSGIVVGVNKFTDLVDIMENYSSPIAIRDFSTEVLSSFYSDPRNWVDY